MTETTIYETDDRAARRRVATRSERPEETLAVFATGRQAPDDDTLRVYRVVDLGSDLTANGRPPPRSPSPAKR
jgi:hypothetical protein